jgi:hypothetical protein
VGIPATYEIVKNVLCQGKSVFRNPFTANDFGLENGNKMVRLSLVCDR